MSDTSFTGVFALSVIAVVYTYVHFSLISETSAHYVNLIGGLKMAVMVGFAYAFFDKKPVSLKAGALNAIGIVVTVVSFFMYSWMRGKHPPMPRGAVAGSGSGLTKTEELTLESTGEDAELADVEESDAEAKKN